MFKEHYTLKKEIFNINIVDYSMLISVHSREQFHYISIIIFFSSFSIVFLDNSGGSHHGLQAGVVVINLCSDNHVL